MKKVFLHGFMGNKDDWKVKSGLTFDLPCFGEHLKFPKNRDEIFQNLFDYLVNELEITDQDMIVGYSLGGRVAMELVYKMKLPIKRCIIFCAHPGLISEDEKKIREMLENKWVTELDNKNEFLKNWYKSPLFQEFIKTNSFNDLYQKRLDDEGTKWAESFQYFGLSKQPNLTNFIKTSQVPMDYFVGEFDKKFKLVANELSQQAKNVNIHEIVGADHALPWLCNIDNEIEKIINRQD